MMKPGDEPLHKHVECVTQEIALQELLQFHIFEEILRAAVKSIYI